MSEANAAFVVLPRSVATTIDALDAALHRAASVRQVSTLAVNVSELAPIGGSPGEGWTLEVYGLLNVAEIAAPLSTGERSSLAIRLHERSATWSFAALRFENVAQVDRSIVTGTRAEVEVALCRALEPVLGPPATEDGLIEAWLARHAATAQVRVIRWNGSTPSSPEWPSGYATPEWLTRVDDEVENRIVFPAMRATSATIVEYFLELETAITDARAGKLSRAAQTDAMQHIEVCRQALIDVIRRAAGGALIDDALEEILGELMAGHGIDERRIAAIVKRLSV